MLGLNAVLPYRDAVLDFVPPVIIASVFDNNWFIFDLVFIVWNLVHGIILVGVLTKADAPFKPQLNRIHFLFVQRIESIPLFRHIVTLGLAIVSVQLWRMSNSGILEATPRAIVGAYTFFTALVLQKLSEAVYKLGPDSILKLEQQIQRYDMLNYKPPSKAIANAIVAPHKMQFRTDITGLDNVPTDHPALYVMNHSLHGLEVPLFMDILYQRKNVFPRGLADHCHFALPQGELLRFLGAVDGTRENVCSLMENKRNILVYPGGGHEVMKSSSIPKYSLMWKERLGFARMAIRYGYPILPCASVGTEDMMDIVYDLPLGFIRKGATFPVTLPIMPWRLQKIYFWFGEPISTTQYNGDWQNHQYAREVRDKAKTAVEKGIQLMQEKQSNDPDRFLITQYINRFRSVKQGMSSLFTHTTIENNNFSQEKAESNRLEKQDKKNIAKNK